MKAFSIGAMVLWAAWTGSASAWADTLKVDAATDLGPLRYGATGFLYGLGEEGIPADPMLAGLRTQVVAQKAPDGAQHPNGDALKTAPMVLRHGGRQIQIYMQDIYQQWPYENLGIDDYLRKVEVMVKKVVADPNHDHFAYIPLNEPDVIWYGGDETKFYHDWKLLFQRIKALDPSAKICGPNYTSYDSQMMLRFLTWARNQGCVPDIITWHELQNDFFGQWDRRLASYRQFEKDLGISPRPIVINEYGRFSGDLAVPGHLLQYVARFERDGVDGCLAYWTTAGGLNDLVVDNRQPTGAWWLYQWYGNLTGHLVTVTPPDRKADGLQGLASLDPNKRQLRILTGGGDHTSVIVAHMDQVFPGETSVHVAVWRTDNVGLAPAPQPAEILTTVLGLTDGQLSLDLGSTSEESAYLILVTPGSTASTLGQNTTWLGADVQPLTGSAAVSTRCTGYQGTGYALLTAPEDGVSFVLNAPQDGYYTLKATFQAPASGSLAVSVSGFPLGPWALPATGETWAKAEKTVFLPAGISIVQFSGASSPVGINGLEWAPATGPYDQYLAAAPSNRLSGKAKIQKDKGADQGLVVTGVGAGPGNTLEFVGVKARVSGTYWLVITYANGALGPGASNYNANIVDQSAEVRVGTGTAQWVKFRNTLGWKNYRTVTVPIELSAGDNSVFLGNPGPGAAPHIAKISVAVPVVDEAPHGS